MKHVWVRVRYTWCNREISRSKLVPRAIFQIGLLDRRSGLKTPSMMMPSPPCDSCSSWWNSVFLVFSIVGHKVPRRCRSRHFFFARLLDSASCFLRLVRGMREDAQLSTPSRFRIIRIAFFTPLVGWDRETESRVNFTERDEPPPFAQRIQERRQLWYRFVTIK